MSKYVKDLVTVDIRRRLEGVESAMLVNISKLDANKNYQFRKDLRAKEMHVLVIKNSLARRATEGTSLAAGFEGLEGSTAVVWGGSDIISVAKELVRISKNKAFADIKSRGGVIDGARIKPEELEAVSKWPTRAEQLSMLVGQILSPGAKLASQLGSVGGALASQIKQRGEEEAESGDAAAGDRAVGDAATGESATGGAAAAPSES